MRFFKFFKPRRRYRVHYVNPGYGRPPYSVVRTVKAHDRAAAMLKAQSDRHRPSGKVVSSITEAPKSYQRIPFGGGMIVAAFAASGYMPDAGPRHVEFTRSEPVEVPTIADMVQVSNLAGWWTARPPAEDDPGFDCRYMGNGSCGAVAAVRIF